MVKKDDSFRDMALEVTRRWVDMYIGSDRDGQLAIRWRVLSAFGGSATYLALAATSGYFVIPDVIEGFQELIALLDEVSFIQASLNVNTFAGVLAPAIVLFSPMALALMIGYSVKIGGPLRCGVLGFLMYAGALSLAPTPSSYANVEELEGTINQLKSSIEDQGKKIDELIRELKK